MLINLFMNFKRVAVNFQQRNSLNFTLQGFSFNQEGQAQTYI